jgi:regulator of nucleoside diphosphate kinase
VHGTGLERVSAAAGSDEPANDVQQMQTIRKNTERKTTMTQMTVTPPAMTTAYKALPPITISGIDFERLSRLAELAADKAPATADFLAREVARATIAPSGFPLRGIVAMGSEVEFRDDVTGQVRTVTLVYPDEADIAAGKVSVLTPIGAALIGLSAGQSIAGQTPAGGWRSLSVLRVG